MELNINIKRQILINGTNKRGSEMAPLSKEKINEHFFQDRSLYWPITILMILVSVQCLQFFSATVEGTSGEDTFLAWTGEEGYFTNGLEPDSGLITDDYDFRIMYTDINGEDPTDGSAGNYIHLVLDDVNYNMTTVDHEYSDGSLFNITFGDISPGSHTYYFEVKVGDTIYRLPKTGIVEEPFVNTPPLLMVPSIGGGAYHESTVYPATGNNTDLFTFQIIYTDADGHQPSDDELSVGVYIDNIYYKMEYMKEIGMGEGDYYDGNFTNGEIYQTSIRLEKGEHHHFFQFTDEAGETVTSPQYSGPLVITGFPDLLVTMDGLVPDIRWEPKSTEPGDWDNVSISSTIENDGGTNIDITFLVNVQIYFLSFISGEAVLKEDRIFSVDGLAVGEEYPLNLKYIPRIMGLYEVWIIIDQQDDVMELVEYNIDDDSSNNIRKARFKAGPDLSISADDISPSTCYNNNDFIPAAIIHNSGSTDAVLNNDILVFFTVGDIEPYSIIIPSGTTIRCGGTYNAGEPVYLELEYDIEEVEITVTIDPRDTLGEAIEYDTFFDNNYAEYRVKIANKVYRTDSPSFNPPLVPILLSLLIVSVIAAKFGKSILD